MLELASTRIHLSEADVAVRNERSHTDSLGELETRFIVLQSELGIRWVATCHDLGERAECQGLIGAFLVLPRQIDCASRAIGGFRVPAGE